MSNTQPSPFNLNCLNNRVALITGGASGIGLEIAKQLGLHGSKIAIMGRRMEFIEKALAVLKELKIDAIGFTGDVRVEEDTNRVVALTVEHFGKLDTLVNSAAGNFLAAAEHLKPKGFRTVLEIDAIGVFNMSKAAFEQLKASKQGVIINISATLHYGATWYQVHASAAKAAIDSVTRTLGLEWGLYNIRVNGIAPGPIADTPGMTKLAPGEGYESLVTEVVPLGKMGQKWDIAMSAVFLCSSAGSFITGETIVVDGGAWLWTPPLMPRDMVGDAARGIEQKSRSKL